ncbi:hypothetical protein HDF26_001734 [Pedobacter cryoconitis]|uniref:hypothetical protein n=1 Tax=Pedobacter cryoconitis TaxID=188932 RepID=UPI0016192B0D|nr:hypothetical protein [Pedobacter cryoconitis]MBB6271307.1 hypothetical protein [Pedobacter cryoconitis]
MKFILPLILLSFTVTLTNAQSGEDFTKTKTIQAVRGFRDQLNYNSRVQQKLLSRINTMINTTKSLSDYK